MTESTSEMRSIWFLVGILLLVMGALVLAGGVLDLVRPPARMPVLGHLRAGLWWGGVTLLAGAIFTITNWRRTR